MIPIAQSMTINSLSTEFLRRGSSFFYGRYGKFNKDVYGVPMNSHNRNTETHRENQRNTDPDRQTDRQTETHTHTHTPGRQECDMLGTSWWFP